MTLQETRQLGIEFERRIQTMIPEKELIDKLDSDTIYSFLNLYQDKYIHDIYRSLDLIPSGTKLSAHVEAVLLAMLRDEEITMIIPTYTLEYESDPEAITVIGEISLINPDDTVVTSGSFTMKQLRNKYNISQDIRDRMLKLSKQAHIGVKIGNDCYYITRTNTDIYNSDVEQNISNILDPNGILISDVGRSVKYQLPSQFYMYVRSVSKVSNTFSFKSNPEANNASIRVLPNELVSQNDVWKLIETPHNSLRILRHPAAVLSKYNNSKPTLTVIYDQYTTPLGIKVLYYAEPAHFDVMTSTPCELPMDVFDDLVSGAVDLYVQYVAGAEARKRLMQEAARQQQKQAEKNRNNED